jgi:ubiquinone biosynthesis protein UbiJ
MATAAVVLEAPETMNLLGLLLRSILERNLADPAKAGRAARLKGEVAVRGGKMRVTLRFAPEGVTITRAAAARPRARVEGSLAAFLGVAQGKGIVSAWLSGRLSAKGNLLFLLKIMPLLRSAPAV